MIRIQFPDSEIEALERVLRTTADPKVHHRVQIVLMAHRGRRPPEIVADAGTSQRSVQRWLNAYLDGGQVARMTGLAPQVLQSGAPGREGRLLKRS
jgi:hypothetical protein